MKASEYRTKSSSELAEALESLLKEQFNLRMQIGSQQEVRTHRVREVRRDIARIKTVMNESGES